MGSLILGFTLRAAHLTGGPFAFCPNERSTSSSSISPAHRLARFWRAHCDCLPDRAACSIVIDLSSGPPFQKLVANNRRAGAYLFVQSNLGCLGGLSDPDRAGPDLDFRAQTNCPAHFCSDSASDNISADSVAGALGLFLFINLRDFAPDFTHVDQLARRSMDRICAVDLSDRAILGRAHLA